MRRKHGCKSRKLFLNIGNCEQQTNKFSCLQQPKIDDVGKIYARKLCAVRNFCGDLRTHTRKMELPPQTSGRDH